MPSNETIATDYRSTLNLPRTDFPMRGDLPKREPERVAWWHERGVYERRLAANEGNPQWILHDGPPYANGDLHMGHFVNRVLKDVFVKVHLLDGKVAKFVPGWDMHGLPIEFETLKHLGLDFHRVDPIELRAKCRERALHWLDIQRDTILRMGVLGDYEHPYRTIDKEFEATIVETLATLAEAKQLYKGLRSTLWCVRDETALAEAEIEYKDRISPSIYVRFTASAAQRADLLARAGVDAASLGGGTPLSILIWTTTPWTLPANVAIALKAEASYGVYRRGDELILLADDLAESVFARAAGPAAERVGGARGTALVGAAVRHPFIERDSLVVSADYVELDSGTGAVHTAPGHGADDFETGMRFGLPILCPVDGSGHFTNEAGPYAGLAIFDANERIIGDLEASGALFARNDYEHSYPHCWRCKQPVIFRSTSQWFIAMDVNKLRKRIEEKIPSVAWFPAWGEHRMLQMIENHPEWCVSRQRTWGTPIPAIVCRSCGDAFLDPDVARTVAAVFRERGVEGKNASDLWWTEPVETFLPENFACATCNGRSFEKEFNIVDIWFESGVTHRAVLRQRGMHVPADLYLEGSDQYRGWFRSNLITAVATSGAPPYKGVVSTGWVVDEHGRAMHKSTGNYLGARDAMQTYGADVLRLWVASVEFTADMRLGEGLLKSISSVYRNLRNRLRMLLGLIDDLAPDELVTRERLEPIDRLALAKLDDVANRVSQAYKSYRLHDVYLALVDYDTSDLSSFYVDLLKDPMYSGARDGRRRKSAQTTLFRILETLCALLAPLLSFTAEEAWQSVPEPLRAGRESVFDLALANGSERGNSEADELALWEMLKGMRAAVAASDGPRDFQLQAAVRTSPALEPKLRALGDNLREALVVSALQLAPDESLAAGTAPQVVFSAAAGSKCSRCWKTLPLGDDALHPTLCAPCASIVRALEVSP
ncbi:MAG: isoleucine--tRNA ligase [Candidatus Eremiobacteraeota bacterium]|nr:isoleucine--tRNA ligase [Candidatus Eremiobacteraeota bacterium]